ncbi:MAG: M23 family metallopeptidase [Baekduia sp.]
MRPRASLLVLGLLSLTAPPAAVASAGGSAAPVAGGGSEYGAPGKRAQRKPVVRTFRVSPTRLTVGALPRITVRIDQRAVDRVDVRVALVRVGSRVAAATLTLDDAPTGKTLRPSWPSGTTLRAGRYVARVHARSPDGATLRRTARASGVTHLVVVRPKPKPKPVATPAPAPAPAPAGGVFPVAGPHTIAGPGGGFGADRGDHRHEGQDIPAAIGTPVVAPLAGTVLTTAYQRGGAGFYVVIDTDDGRSFFFAHCRGNSTAVAAGQRVSAGQQLCLVGTSGRSTGPHLHFEIWTGGWRRDKNSRPVDPLPQLRAWAR